MTRWGLTRPASNRISIAYECAPRALRSCTPAATAWNSNGGGQTNFLDRHPFTCPAGAMLQRWRLESNGAAGTMRVAYTCCSV